MDLSKLKGVVPGDVLVAFALTLDEYHLSTPLRAAHFLAQCAHESANFTKREENLNYDMTGLLRVFPKYFNPGNVEPYVRKPIEIASRVYANRMGNGPEESLEGWFYRGRGYLQITGKDNYTAFDKLVEDNLVLYPELVATKYPLESAAWFWNTHHLNDKADRGSDQQVVADITKVINGGYNGLADRQDHFDNIYNRIK